MRNKKTVFLIRNLAPGDYGGGERYQVELARVLKKNGFVPIIFTSSMRLTNEAKAVGVKVVKAPFLKWQNWSGWRNLLLPIFFVWQVWLKCWYKKQIKKYDPCVLNVQSRDELIGATLAGVNCGRRVIWTDHADFRTWSLINVDKRLKNQIGKWILRCAKKVDKIIMINEYEKRSLEELIRPRKLNNLVVVGNGVVDEYSSWSKVRPRRDSFYYIGRVVKDKGVFELMEAFLRVVKKYPDITLSVYGDGEELEKCKELVGGDKRVTFYGYTEHPLGAVAQNEVFVFPSYHEGMSLALLEAVMMEKKIIATNIEGNREIVHSGAGLMVPVGDVRGLEKAMIWMIENKIAAKEMAKKARKYYQENFDFDKIFVEKMLALYNIEKETKK